MEVTGFITALVIGLIIGVLGRIVAPGRQNIPVWLTLVVGVAVIAVIALAMGFVFRQQVLRADTGTDKMREIGAAVEEGAQAYLARQFKTLGIFVVLAFLLCYRDWAVIALAAGVTALHHLSFSQLQELGFGVRCLLEPEAVRLAVGNGIDLAAAQHALERSEAAKDSAERSIANRDFHRLTYASCGNPLLLSMLDDLRDQTALISVTAWQNGITWVHEAHEHVAILEAAARGDAEEAKHLVDLHIRRFTEHALTLLEEHHA